MSKMVEELTKWFENYGVIIPDGSSATIRNFMFYSEIETMADELYEDFFTDLETKLADAEEHIDNLELQLREQYQLVDEMDKKITRLREHKKVDCQTIQHYSDELALTEKALKLACEDLWCMSVWENTKEEVIQDYIEHFKTKAKEMMKDE